MRGTLSRRILGAGRNIAQWNLGLCIYSALERWSRPATFMARVLESESSTHLISQSETQNATHNRRGRRLGAYQSETRSQHPTLSRTP